MMQNDPLLTPNDNPAFFYWMAMKGRWNCILEKGKFLWYEGYN